MNLAQIPTNVIAALKARATAAVQALVDGGGAGETGASKLVRRTSANKLDVGGNGLTGYTGIGGVVGNDWAPALIDPVSATGLNFGYATWARWLGRAGLTHSHGANGYIRVPTANGSTAKVNTIQWGTVSLAVTGTPEAFNFPTAFTTCRGCIVFIQNVALTTGELHTASTYTNTAFSVYPGVDVAAGAVLGYLAWGHD